MQSDFEDWWKTQPLVTRVAWEQTIANFIDEKLPITTLERDPDAGEGFVAAHIVHADNATQVALGQKTFEYRGVMTLAVFGEAGKGRQRGAGLLAEQALQYFQDAKHRVAYWKAFPRNAGRSGRFYRINVQADFLYQVKRNNGAS